MVAVSVTPKVPLMPSDEASRSRSPGTSATKSATVTCVMSCSVSGDVSMPNCSSQARSSGMEPIAERSPVCELEVSAMIAPAMAATLLAFRLMPVLAMAPPAVPSALDAPWKIVPTPGASDSTSSALPSTLVMPNVWS